MEIELVLANLLKFRNTDDNLNLVSDIHFPEIEYVVYCQSD